MSSCNKVLPLRYGGKEKEIETRKIKNEREFWEGEKEIKIGRERKGEKQKKTERQNEMNEIRQKEKTEKNEYELERVKEMIKKEYENKVLSFQLYDELKGKER